MRIGIYCSIDVGEVKDKSIQYIGVDKGVEYLVEQGIKPIIAIGDMDSIENTDLLNNMNIQRYSSIKDDTDTALALEYAFSLGYDEIDLYGVTKKRMDHFMAVLALLEKYKNKHIVIYDEYNKIQVLNKGEHRIVKDGYKYFSLFAFDETILSIKDAHYPLDNYLLKRCDPLCVSNQMNDEHAYITTSESILLIQSH